MKIAIMQPYLFPYLGYYQMVNHVDKFVFLDDVNYIKKGWINRNKIPTKNGDLLFTAPLHKASQNTKICNTLISPSYNAWKAKFLKSLEQNYKNSTGFSQHYDHLRQILDTPHTYVSTLSAASISSLAECLKINTEFIFSSDLDCPGHREYKIINICNKLGATEYINAPGGKNLYNYQWFNERGVELKFLEPDRSTPMYSIIHTLLSSPEAISKQINQYSVV